MNRCRDLVLFAAVSAILLALAAPLHSAENSKVMKYICNDLKGNIRWKAVTTIKPSGNNTYILTDEGSGTYYGFDKPVKWRSDAEFSDDGDRILPIKSKKIVTSQDGKVIYEGCQAYDIGKGEMTYTRKWLDSGKETSKVLKYKGDVVNEFTMGVYFERFLKKNEKEKTLYLVSNDPSIYEISAVIEGEEEITVNGSKQAAYKIRLDPNVGLFGAFAPKTFVWHMSRPNFDWLKYKGAEDTVDSPEVEIETLDIKK